MFALWPLGVVAASSQSAPAWVSHLGVTLLLGLLPFVVVAGTSFAKIALVLGILRSALGAPGVPPASVLSALAVALSLFVMAPVASDVASAVEAANLAAPVAGADPWGLTEARRLYEAASPPLLDFLSANTPRADIDFFASLQGRPAPAEPGLSLLLPAFAISEIVEAFLIGFLLFLPFLVIDLVVATSLAALGLVSLPVTAVSLPLKLLLFVAVDGLRIMVQGLVVTYGY